MKTSASAPALCSRNSRPEEKFRQLFENAVEGIFQTTPDGTYLSVNPALARMYGYSSPAELIETVRNIGQVVYVDPRRREEFQRRIEEHGFLEAFESEVFRKDGTKIWISESARAVRDENGHTVSHEAQRPKTSRSESDRRSSGKRAWKSCTP